MYWDTHGLRRMLTGDDILPSWARQIVEALEDSFAQTEVGDLRYWIRYRQSFCRERTICRIKADYRGPRPAGEVWSLIRGPATGLRNEYINASYYQGPSRSTSYSPDLNTGPEQSTSRSGDRSGVSSLRCR